jgi:hypothetical protein
VLRVGDCIDPEALSALEGERCASASGASLHANVAVPARDRRRLERLILGPSAGRRGHVVPRDAAQTPAAQDAPGVAVLENVRSEARGSRAAPSTPPRIRGASAAGTSTARYPPHATRAILECLGLPPRAPPMAAPRPEADVPQAQATARRRPLLPRLGSSPDEAHGCAVTFRVDEGGRHWPSGEFQQESLGWFLSEPWQQRS